MGKQKEPMHLLVDGNNWGIYTIDQFIDRYWSQVMQQAYTPTTDYDLDNHDVYADRDNSQFREFADWVNEEMSLESIFIKAEDGTEYSVHWMDGDIWAVHLEAVACEECEHNYYFPLQHYYPLGNYNEYTIASHYLSAIINNDWSGLEADESAKLDKWLKGKGYLIQSPTCCEHCAPGTDNFRRCDVTGLLANCVDIYEPTEL